MADLSDAARLLQAAGQSKKAFLSSMRGFNGALDDVANFDIFGFSKEMKDVSTGDLIGMYFEPETGTLILKEVPPTDMMQAATMVREKNDKGYDN